MTRRQQVVGWIALGISTVVSGVWAFWGTCEAFHEGWWSPTLLGRLGQTAAYHVPLLLTLLLACLAIAVPRVGGGAYVLLGTLFSVFILRERLGQASWTAILSWVPVTVLVVAVGLLWWFGRPRPRRLAFLIVLGLPLLTSLACAIEPVWRISSRSLVAQLSMQEVKGNAVTLTWAPEGPGWVRGAREACTWDEARALCARLSADGTRILEEESHIWRLPTAEEAVRSLTRHQENAGGAWDEARRRATYQVRPDKEPPLWDPLAETIYWWTATETDEGHAYIVVYDGGVYERDKRSDLGSQGFRAVKNVQP